MTELFESLKKECAEAGTNLTEVCREAGIDRSVPERWKNETPKTVVALEKLRSIIKQKKEAQQKQL